MQELIYSFCHSRYYYPLSLQQYTTVTPQFYNHCIKSYVHNLYHQLRQKIAHKTFIISVAILSKNHQTIIYNVTRCMSVVDHCRVWSYIPLGHLIDSWSKAWTDY